MDHAQLGMVFSSPAPCRTPLAKRLGVPRERHRGVAIAVFGIKKRQEKTQAEAHHNEVATTHHNEAAAAHHTRKTTRGEA